MGAPETGLRVYPRPRGGTLNWRAGAVKHVGLSPPTRGNPSFIRYDSSTVRSIPAHAGEPRGGCPIRDRERVYPRPRGGTRPRSPPLGQLPGLSPPTRGNPSFPSAPFGFQRSIPAHAGEPRRQSGFPAAKKVYPRPRGGTTRWRTRGLRRRGLSPPTRGNHAPLPARLDKRRSIPAHAGEPKPGPGRLHIERVYPRPRGGTAQNRSSSNSLTGLSPPTRGNLRPGYPDGISRRSIPAHAGEPASTSDALPAPGVYPRPRGGTPREHRLQDPPRGLSPPTRGNPPAVDDLVQRPGSIPAHAGEPR